jgi:CRP/FNR family transcriptional regulator, anaerobic regulatory protein
MTEKHKHQLAQLFEKPLIEEFDNALFQELPSGAVLRHDTQTRVRYTPLVLEGRIRVTRTDDNGRELFIYNIDPSESCFLTISASINQDFRGTDALNAVTEGKTAALFFNDTQIRTWFEKYPTWRTFIFKLINDRMLNFFTLIDDYAFKSVEERLLDTLKGLAQTENPVKITHQGLANRLGTAREVVSRHLKSLENQGQVRLAHGQIELFLT